MEGTKVSVDFEVFGKVQGVFFRKFTQKQATALGVKGWIMNTPTGTVKGTIQGPPKKVIDMKQWLQSKGSPKSVIKSAIFSNEKEITKYGYDEFIIKR